MKKTYSFFLIFAIGVILAGCDGIKYRSLFRLTDKAVESFSTSYLSYGLLGGDTEYTPDKKYKVFPIGRLVNVRIESSASNEDYEELRAALENHYKGNPNVLRVYRCRAGTIMIDCRK